MFCSVVLCTSNVSEALDSTYYLQLKIKSRKLCTFPLLNILSNSLKDISLSFSLFFKNQIIFSFKISRSVRNTKSLGIGQKLEKIFTD